MPEGDAPLQECRAIGGRLVVLYLRDATSELRVLDRREERFGAEF